MLKHDIQSELVKAYTKALAVQPGTISSQDIQISIPSSPTMGTYSSNASLALAKQYDQKPDQLSHKVADLIDSDKFQIEVPPMGFVNITVNPEEMALEIKEILKNGNEYGKNHLLKNQKIQVEFISANPTGPLTLANGRGGAIGDTLANVLTYSDAIIQREYYVNDTGNQVRVLAESTKSKAGLIEALDTHYQGEYIQDLSEKFKDQLHLPSQELGHQLALHMLETEIKPAITRLGVHFDSFYSESSLFPDKINQTLQKLQDVDLAYQKDGAWWFRSTKFGDDKDRVLMTSTEARGQEEPTYFLSDLAHHLDIYSQGFDKRVLVIGSDHHSYFQRLSMALEALLGSDRLHVILMQLVKLIKDGQEVRMSKRAGNYVTLDELLDLVSPDAVRYFFLMNAETNHMEFDLSLAKEQSQKNPVFYVQYAHARMSNILNKQPLTENPQLELLASSSEQNLIRHLLEFPDLVQEIATTYKVHHLSTYAYKLADLFHKFYEDSPVIKAGNPSLVQARLSLVKASQITLANTLGLMGISAPEKM